MKIIGTASSPHRTGNSVGLLREALKDAQEAGAEAVHAMSTGEQ